MQVPLRTHVSCRIQRPNAPPGHVTPTLQLSRFRPIISAPKPPNLGAEKPHPLPSLADGVVISEPFWERPAGTQTHSRRTGRKLGQLRCARQELVRVPESNTKYGGKRGKTGGAPTPVIDPSISESTEIPKRKKSSRGCGATLRPAVHRATIFSRSRIALWRLT